MYKHDDSSLENDDSSLKNDDSSTQGDAATVLPGGWHSDYPFPSVCDPRTGKAAKVTHTSPEEYEKLDQSISSRVPDWRNRQTRLGVQFIIALTDFTADTGGTQFVLGSNLADEPPSVDYNATPTVAGVGVHKDVTQVPCPAGSAVIYDSRTYHRACPELNVSGEERMAMLNCTVPSFVRAKDAMRKIRPADQVQFYTKDHEFRC